MVTLPIPAESNAAYLNGLNPPQREAVTTVLGPVLVLAGAGTGKTRVLTTRLAHLIHTRTCWPSQILAVTFTNKAANEMRERVAAVLGQPVEGWWLGTFHSLAARMLRVHAEKVGLTSGYTIIDDDDQLRLVKQILEAENFDLKKTPPRLALSIINGFKDKALIPADVAGARELDGRAGHVYRLYQDRLKTVNACDFGDLLLHMITILKNPAYDDVRRDYHQKFKYIMVDEYQDTNTAQYLWLRLLVGPDRNICCVGDDDQSIYGWRGAEITNILRFEQDFPGAKIIRLEQNYRSTNHILGAASRLIAHNGSRLGKTLWSAADAGDPVQVNAVWDGEAEARWISDDIEHARARGQKLSTMAILVRAGFQMREFEERFIQIGLPYRVFGGPRFYERAEIRDALAYLRVICQPNDDLALERIINLPKRGLGDSTLQAVHTHARAQESSLYVAIEQMIGAGMFKPKVLATLQALFTQFGRWRSLLSTTEPAELAGVILDESGYSGMWMADKSPDAPGRLENLKELVGTIGDYETLPAFLEHVALVMDNAKNANGDAVSIMTLHAAKGLEFDTVFLPGWEEGIFPSGRTVDESGVTGLEEERRLAYVGLTRAKKRAVVLCAGSRRQYGSWVQNMPSRFIGELPDDHVIVIGADKRAFGSTAPTRQISAPSYPGNATQDANGQMIEAQTRVQHREFGDGTVIHVANNKLDVVFDSGQKHRILAGFVQVL
jgi:DNA helicase-2/ATP-dependent DNA helicase PcrA